MNTLVKIEVKCIWNSEEEEIVSELLEMASNQENNLQFLKEPWRMSSIHLVDIYLLLKEQ